MRCEELERIVFSGGEVTEEMRAHARTCEACRALLDNADVLAGAAQMDEDTQIPASFASGWRAAVREDAAERAQKAARPGVLERMKAVLGGSRRGMARGLAYAMCAVVLLGVGVQLGGRQTASVSYSQKNYMAAGGSRMMGGAAMDTGVMLTSMAYDEAAAEPAAEEMVSEETGEARKIIRTAQLDLKVEDMDSAVLSITAQVEAVGGVISYSEVSGYKGEGRYGSMEVQVPGELLDSFLAGAGGLGTVTRQSTQQTDMTAQYRDNASRLESARAQKQRLDELYAQAEDMTDVVTITDAIFEVQREIDELTGANNRIDDRVSMSRVHLSLTETVKKAVAPDPTFFELLGEHFTDGFASIGSFFSGIVLFAAWALPWAALMAAVFFAVRFILRRRR